jgi:carboxyl-terminal processing protease
MVFATGSGCSAETPDPGQICASVGRLLEQGHYSKNALDNEVSKKLLGAYLHALDFNRLFFTAKDVAEFEKRYASSLDDDILLGNPAPAFEIHDLFVKRVEARVAHVKGRLAKPFVFKSDRTIEWSRKDSPWPVDEAAADALWKDRLDGECLQERLATKNGEKPEDVLNRRYDQLLKNIKEETSEETVKTFLSTLATVYDPHSEYMSKSDLDNFGINMRLSLFGIGAVLRSDDGYAKIDDLVTGGPAEASGQVKVGDRISAVAQGDAEFVETVGMKLDKVVRLIRGEKGTKVRLRILPEAGSDPSARKSVEIVRDEVKLKEQEAKAEIVERPGPDGTVMRLGWITLPSFYADMDHLGDKGAKSTTRDVQRLLDRLKKEGIGGLVIDLRRNGGGSLEEAVNLTGLFIKKGPVVQAKDANGGTKVSQDKDPEIAYEGPMVVLTNRLSASASEIFAGALQDYRRALVVGDESTFGKGTVQTILQIGRFIPFLRSSTDEAGALKLTIQKFYRVAGGSTQFKGVTSDIVLPSMFDHDDLGERALDFAMPYDEVDPARFDAAGYPLFADDLRERSKNRVAKNPEFQYVVEDLARLKNRIAKNEISLNEKRRRSEMEEDKARRKKRMAERSKRKRPDEAVYAVTLDNAGVPELQKAVFETSEEAAGGTDDLDDEAAAEIRRQSKDKRPLYDPVRDETYSILADLVDLARMPKTAKRE